MTPPQLSNLRNYVERVQSSIDDPAERERALAIVERELTDMLGAVQTYRADNRLRLGEVGAGGSNGQH
jgi:hypothetical protein